MALVSTLSLMPLAAAAQDQRLFFAGGLIGVSTLSADARSEAAGTEARLSLYKPGNGPAVDIFVGAHIAQYLSVQGNWMWNRNDVTLVSSFVTPQRGGFYEQRRQSRQDAVVIDGLVYFRRRDSRVRPYLGTGLALVHFSSTKVVGSTTQGLAPPSGAITSTRVGLRSHVGLDVRLTRHLSFRYSFSETISGNPISPALAPPAPRRLANFQNLFGFMSAF